MKKFILPLTVVSIVLFAACSQKTTPAKTENPATANTPPPPPKAAAVTYTANVQALIQSKCAHTPSQGGNKANFENFASAQKYAADIVFRVELAPGTRGFMPMRGTKLADDEIAVFKNWVKGGLLEK
jgi:PBP1b-binding outer membrane lipoprotein LpoB